MRVHLGKSLRSGAPRSSEVEGRATKFAIGSSYTYFRRFVCACVQSGAMILIIGTTVLAEGPSSDVDPLLGGRVKVLEQLVQISFPPDEALVLQERELGDVVVMPASAVPMYRDRQGVVPQALDTLRSEVLVGARVAQGSSRTNSQLHFNFFLFGRNQSFAATPIKFWSPQIIEDNSLSINELSKEIEQLHQQTASLELQNEALEIQVGKLRETASNIAGVDRIVDLKMELQKLQGFGVEREAELSRLRDLIKVAREGRDDAEIEEVRRQLSMQLREAAQATAMADRLQARRRSSAVATLNQKLALIRQMRGYDVDSLTKTALELRAKRKQLEARVPEAIVRPEEREF